MMGSIDAMEEANRMVQLADRMVLGVLGFVLG